MTKRATQPTVGAAIFRFAKQQVVHSAVDGFAARITCDPDIRDHLAQVMYEREDTKKPWTKLTAEDKEIWLRRVACVVREIVSMTQPRIGG